MSAEPLHRGDGPPRTSSETCRLVPAAPLQELIQELLDAHLDTAELASELADRPAWRLHLDYLRALHRRGTELLAGRLEAGRR